ncbi:MAG TPA: single-stranded-DNA-specific exonuclease RecJ [Syntrophobacteraceae bacterium]|nr:single-stranded-DNA-specific exonuclease RecJ [Syntrophobacteraceae bacterium]
MEQDRLLRTRWKILNERSPATVSDVIDIILQNRNIDPHTFSAELKDLAEHLCIRGMSEGALLLAGHMANRSKIVVVADYDCDGITSAAQVALFFQDVGYRDFTVVIPSRSEGYGIPERAISRNRDAKVFLALDCGTLDLGPIRLARSMGADCIVIDHHEMPFLDKNISPLRKGGEHFSEHALAPASVLINPKHPECRSPFKELCASGLTFLFLAALRRALQSKQTGLRPTSLGGKYLALAATGTVADLVPLVSANRILARSGLRNLNANSSAPLSYLASAAGLEGKTLTAGHIGFYLGPRINAAGRISEGQIAYDLLTSTEPSRLARLAHELEGLNAQRRAQEEKTVREIAARLSENPPTRRTLVMASSRWQPGILGIAASRVQQHLYYAPVVILSIDEATGIARGSARSIPGFDIHQAISTCSELLIKWGGHKTAAGLTIVSDRIEEFADRLEEVARRHREEIFIPDGKVDLELPLTFVGPKLVKALEDLEPHGMGNPAPVFALRGARFNSAKVFGKGQNHLKLEFENGLEGIWWRGAKNFLEDKKNLSPSDCGQITDMVFHVGWNAFHKKTMLEIIDLGRLF